MIDQDAAYRAACRDLEEVLASYAAYIEGKPGADINAVHAARRNRDRALQALNNS